MIPAKLIRYRQHAGMYLSFTAGAAASALDKRSYWNMCAEPRAFLLTPLGIGDMNCDGAVDFGDINAFVLYMSNFEVWQAWYPGCPATNGDINGDDTYPSFGDINPFVALLTGG